MRLIDADEFIQYLGLDEENAREDNLGEIVTLEDFDRQETAYDVDKSVKEIEGIISEYELYVENLYNEIKGKNENKMTFEICLLHNNRGYLEGLKKALEIVKSGGAAND